LTVYLRSGSPNYVIEFEFKGERIRQSSGTTKKREAEEIERDLRRQLKEQVAAGGVVQMTLAEAMRRYAETVVKLGRSDGKRELSALKRLGEAFGPETNLDKITAPLVHKWRDDLLSGGHQGTPAKGQPTKERGLKPASINRYLDILKAILRKAHFEWGALLRLGDTQSTQARAERGGLKARVVVDAAVQAIRGLLYETYADKRGDPGCRDHEVTVSEPHGLVGGVEAALDVAVARHRVRLLSRGG
jgi:hypothetical protein